MMSEVSDLLTRLGAGQVPLSQVAADFARREWPPVRQPAQSYEELAAREVEDVEPIEPNSWGEVEVAYTSGVIDDAAYRALFAARERAGRS